MARAWYATPYRVRPGTPVPGRFDGSDYVGPSAREFAAFRGPANSCGEVVKMAVRWREGGRRSDIWLVLVEHDECTHCMKFDEDRVDTEPAP